jgi:FlaA1/EpsC-like NDP-sugar epimerase
MTTLRLNLFSIFFLDIALISAAWVFSHLLRFNFLIPPESHAVMMRFLPMVIVVKELVFYLFDLYRGMWRYTGLSDLLTVIRVSFVASLIILAMIVFTHTFESISRAIFIIDAILTIFFLGGSRVAIRLFFWLSGKDRSVRSAAIGLLRPFPRVPKGSKRLLILGAGDSGEKILRETLDNPSLRYTAVGFVDDDPGKVGRFIHGVPVLGTTSELCSIARKTKAESLLIAIPSASAAEMRQVVFRCEETGLPCKTVPGIGELIDGRVTVKTIRDVAYGDLLGREAVRLEDEKIGSYLEKAVVMITGPGGSIGSELCRQIGLFKPAEMLLFERAESPLYDMELELRESFPHIKIVPILGDITVPEHLTSAFSVHRPSVVFHAAAYKHVPMLEHQPWRAVTNNIVGTGNVIDAAVSHGVDRFVLVSTDKAVRPTSAMGASKRVTEMLAMGRNGSAENKTKFMIVRFGNVVGSVGSVIPLFKKQIEKGGPVTITDAEMTRYFMTIPEASQLILQAGSMGSGGEIFILDMGRPVKILDMARDLIRLSGFKPDVDIEIKEIGLRPGEKLFEELITEGEGIVPTSHEKIMVLKARDCDNASLNGIIEAMVERATAQDCDGVKKLLAEAVEDYRPFSF